MIIKDVSQRTDEWEFLRKGRITGTRLKDIDSSSKPRVMKELVSEAMELEDPKKILKLRNIWEVEFENPMDRGTRLEPYAIKIFEKASGKKVKSIGFIISEIHQGIASSPDGYIDNGLDDEAIEIKCPLLPTYWDYYIKGKVPTEYIKQIHQYFIVNPKLTTLHFVCFNPLAWQKPMFEVLVKREDLLDVEYLQKLELDVLEDVENKVTQIKNKINLK